MDETMRKVYDCEIKKLNDYTFEFTASTEGIDRDGEVIEAKGWDLKNFKKNPVIYYAHDYKGLPVGRAPKVWVSDGTLRNHVEFPPDGTYELADIVRRLVDAGYLRAESVGFIPKEWEDGDGEKIPKRTYKKAELLEISIVGVPSNPDALVSAREAGVITTKEFDVISKPEETEDYIRIPVKGEEGKHEGHRIRTIDIDKDKGIKALYCGECKKVTTYLFSKEHDWTMESAQEWVREHSKSVNQWLAYCEEMYEKHEIGKLYPAWLADTETGVKEIKGEPIPEKPISQEGLRDEFDYLTDSIRAVGLNEDNQELAWEMVREIMGGLGSHIPIDIAEKVGAVLNQKNKDRLEQIKALAQQVIDSAQREEEPEKAIQSKKLDTIEIAEAVAAVISKIKGKI